MHGKLDENMRSRRVAILNAAGWQCDSVFDEALGDAQDARVSQVCRAEGRVLFTIDLDFAHIRAYLLLVADPAEALLTGREQVIAGRLDGVVAMTTVS